MLLHQNCLRPLFIYISLLLPLSKCRQSREKSLEIKNSFILFETTSRERKWKQNNCIILKQQKKSQECFCCEQGRGRRKGERERERGRGRSKRTAISTRPALWTSVRLFPFIIIYFFSLAFLCRLCSQLSFYLSLFQFNFYSCHFRILPHIIRVFTSFLQLNFDSR